MTFRLGFNKDDEPVWFNLANVTHITKGVDDGFYRIENTLDPDSYCQIIYIRLPKPNEILEDEEFVKMTQFWSDNE